MQSAASKAFSEETHAKECWQEEQKRQDHNGRKLFDRLFQQPEHETLPPLQAVLEEKAGVASLLQRLITAPREAGAAMTRLREVLAPPAGLRRCLGGAEAAGPPWPR